MNRVITASLSALILIGALAAGFFYYQKHKTGSSSAVKAIPVDASFFIQCNGIADLEKITATDYWLDISKNKSAQGLKKSLDAFLNAATSDDQFEKLFATSPLLISAQVTRASDFDFLFLSSMANADAEEMATKLVSSLAGNENVSRRKYEGVEINELALEGGKQFTYAFSKGVFTGSFTPFLVEDAIRQQRYGKLFSGDKNVVSLYDEVSAKGQPLLFINYHRLPDWLAVYLDPAKENESEDLERTAGWAALRLDIQKDGLYLDGNVVVSDTSETVYCLNGQHPVQPGLFSILPERTAMLSAYSLSDFQSWYSAFDRSEKKNDLYVSRQALIHGYESKYKFPFRSKFLQWIGNEWAMAVTEPGSRNYDNNVYGIFKAKNITEAKKSLQALNFIMDKNRTSKNAGEEYNKHSIRYLDLPDFLPALFGNTFSRLHKLYYTDINGYIIFANQPSSLRNFIDDIESKNLLASVKSFKSVQLKMMPACNYTFYAKIPYCNYILKSVASDYTIEQLNNLKPVTDKTEAIIYQLSAEGKWPLCKIITTYKSAPEEKKASLLWTAQLDSFVSTQPVVIMDSSEGVKNIVVQDKSNTLYFMDNAGAILWKKQLNEPILGKIQSVDYFKNGARQLLFSTATYLYLLDFDGQNKGNYPIRLPVPATNGVSAMDFDGTLNYKLIIACSNHSIYAYEISGKPWSQWKFTSTEGIVTSPLEYFRMKNKEAIAFSDDAGTVYALNRNGETILTIREKFYFQPGMPLCFAQRGDTSFSILAFDAGTGMLNEIHENGTITKVEAGPGRHNGFSYTKSADKKTGFYYFTGSNSLAVYNQNLDQDFSISFEDSLSGSVRIFNETTGRKLIGLNAASVENIYLLKPNGMLLNGFPVKGSGYYTIDDLSLDGRYYLVAGSNENVLNVYSLE